MKYITFIVVVVAIVSFARAQSDGSSYSGTGPVAANTFSANDLDANRPHMTGTAVLRTNYHTGLSFSAHSYYGGIRFYNQGYLPTISNPYDSTAGAVMVMSINDGNVGVGTPSPSFPLEVANSNALSIAYQRTGVAAKKWGFLSDNYNTYWQNITDGVLALTVSNAGNVGIGTTNPSAKLHIVSGDNTIGSILATNDEGPGELRIRSYTTQPAIVPSFGIVHAFYNDERNGFIKFWRGNSACGGFLTFGTGGDERMRLDPAGNVGIGTTNPTEKLSVKGKIRAQEVIVETTGWSDHVFADSYHLTPLSEVEQHIKTEKHLPGVPSAQEVAAKGVSVGDMQAILLAKIEELTLHVIRQEKTLAEATAKIDAQQAEIVRLKTQTK